MNRALALVAIAVGLVLLLLLLLEAFDVGPDADVDREDTGSTAQETRVRDGAPETPPATIPPVLRGLSPVDVPLARDEGGVYGVVLDGATGTPVAGVTVHALRVDFYHAEHVHLAAAVSDENGRYRLRGIGRHWADFLVFGEGAGWFSAVDWPETWHDPDDVPHPASLRFEVAEGAWIAHDVRVRRSVHVEGTVQGPDGRPVPGARVTADRRGSGGFPWHVLPPRTSDASGRFELDLPPHAERFVAAARAEGFVEMAAPVPAGEPGTTRHVRIAFPPPHEAVIRVVDAEDETPVEGAEVRFEWLGYGMQEAGETWTEVVSGADGVARLAPVPDDGFSVSVFQDGYVAFGYDEESRYGQIATQTAPGRWEGTAQLRRLAAIEGRIVWPDGVAVPDGGFLRARGITKGVNTSRSSVANLETADTFRVEVYPAGRYRLGFFLRVDDTRWAASAEADVGARDVVLEPSVVPKRLDEDRSDWGRWRLTLRDPSGRPLARAGERDSMGCDVATLLPGEGLEAGRLDVLVEPRREGWLRLGFAEDQDGQRLGFLILGPLAAAGGARDVVWPAARTIEGRVIGPDGIGMQGVKVTATPDWPFDGYIGPDDEALTDADGRFVLRDLLQSHYEVDVVRPGRWIVPPPQPAEAGASGLVFRLASSVTHDVVVRDGRGEPVAHAFVILWQKDGVRGPGEAVDYDGIHVWTRPDGTVRVEGLEAGGTYSLRIEPPDERPDLLVHRDEGWRPRDEDVVLLEATALRGTVRSSRGEPVAEAEVFAVQDGRVQARAATRSDGTFRLQGLRPGPARLGVCFHEVREKGWAPPTPVEARGSDEGVDLVLDSARDVTVRVAVPEGGARDLWRIDVTTADERAPAERHRVDLDEAGRVIVRGLAPGVRYRLWGGPTGSGAFVLAEIGLQQRQVDVVLTEGGVIEGRLRLPRGASKTGVKIVKRGIHCHAPPARGGRYRLVGVPPGRWVLEAWCHVRGERIAVRREAEAGKTVDFDLVGR